jgi:hypothetical protein
LLLLIVIVAIKRIAGDANLGDDHFLWEIVSGLGA